MNKIEKLIEELCPEGVPSATLEDLGTIYTGLSGKSKEDFSLGNYLYVSYLDIGNNPRLPEDIESKVKILDGETQNSIQQGDLLFAGSSEDREGVGLTSEVQHTPSAPTYLNSFCFGWRPTIGTFHSGFLRHLFRSDFIRTKVRACSNGVTRINISKKLLLKIEIPVPPLVVQQEIVSILDKLTELEAELGAELEARSKQLEVFRNKAIGSEKSLKTEKPLPAENVLSEHCELVTDRLQHDGLNDMTYVGVEDLLKNKLGAKLEEKSLIPGSYLSFMAGDILIGNIRPYLKKIWFADRTGLTNGDVLVIRAKGVEGLRVSARYLMQVLSSERFFDHLVSNSKGAKMPRGDKSTALNFRISFPSIEKQKYIARKLESLSELVNSSILGIPAEITARRQQYEYYRNKLLTFKELKAS